jgi:hypothetical protein
MDKYGAFVAKRKQEIFEDLLAGNEPRIGEFSSSVLKECRTKGKPQMGAAVPQPHQITLEFVYSDPVTGATILPVVIPSPERIVWMPVPEWVVENIWQGEVSGRFCFESEALEHLDRLKGDLEPARNAVLFGPSSPTRRE